MAQKLVGKYIQSATIDSTHLAASAKQATLESKLLAFHRGVLNFAASASSSDDASVSVLAAASTDTARADLTAKGIYTGAVSGANDPKRVLIRAAGTDNGLDDGTGDEVYGVLSEAAGVYTLSYKKADGSAHTFGGPINIDFYFVEVGDLYDMPVDSMLIGGVNGVVDATTADVINGHMDGGASKHDASEIDYELADGSKLVVQAGSDTVEAALTDLDASLGGHYNGGASKHDASEVDFEYADGSKLVVQAGSDDVENALIDLDTALGGHLNGSAGKHDASEVDYERADGSKKNVQAASDDVETAITDLDDAIGSMDATPTNYTPTDAGIVADHLAAIDTTLTQALSQSFVDDQFEVKDNADNTKKVNFQVSGVTAGQTRTISAADRNVALDNITEDKVEYHTLTAPEITAKAFTLADTPKSASKVRLCPMGGIPQEYSTDYTVSGNTVDFNGLGLDGVLVAGEVVRVEYEING